MLLKRLIISFAISLCIGSISGYVFEEKKYFCLYPKANLLEFPKKWANPEDCFSKSYYNTSHALAVGALTLGLCLLIAGILYKENK